MNVECKNLFAFISFSVSFKSEYFNFEIVSQSHLLALFYLLSFYNFFLKKGKELKGKKDEGMSSIPMIIFSFLLI